MTNQFFVGFGELSANRNHPIAERFEHHVQRRRDPVRASKNTTTRGFRGELREPRLSGF